MVSLYVVWRDEGTCLPRQFFAIHHSIRYDSCEPLVICLLQAALLVSLGKRSKEEGGENLSE